MLLYVRMDYLTRHTHRVLLDKSVNNVTIYAFTTLQAVAL